MLLSTFLQNNPDILYRVKKYIRSQINSGYEIKGETAYVTPWDLYHDAEMKSILVEIQGLLQYNIVKRICMDCTYNIKGISFVVESYIFNSVVEKFAADKIIFEY